ncbi:cuticle protein [Ceratitis capitata]|uniref:cuticle protein n=1 Tax=Ceratitis capitata TaxID=7213 RepID=UPI0006188F0B|nr:cuticle protein [Ceratitis capitata]
MAFKFVFLVSIVALSALADITSAEFDYNPELYNGNNSNNNNNNNNNNKNVNTYSDSVQQPANSYSAPLTALNGFNNNNNNNAAPPQQQQQSTLNGYNYNANNLPKNNYNNNAAPQQQQLKLPQQQQNNYAYNNGGAEKPLTNGVPTPVGYDYTPQNLAALSASSSSSSSSSSASSVGTFGRLQTSFSAQAHQSAAPVEEYNPPAKYDYSYNVHNEDTNDIKSHAEARDGYFVQGSYTVVDPDGFQRTVSYTVDGPSGFNAVVNRVPFALKPLPTVRTPASTAAPVAQLAELPLTTGVSLEQSSAASASATVAGVEQQESTDTTRIDLPVQPSDSYLTPPVDSRDGKGPYP